ncbi:tRNA-splicing endonuclease subunit SEN2 [Ditylenchus destructor]|nr:tRNA-splicing endonuclease subunit SEN2 [Ditylenchus destructor]
MCSTSLLPDVHFDKKHCESNDNRRASFGDTKKKFHGYIHGLNVVIKDEAQAKEIYSIGNFGSFIGARMNFTNQKCFPHSNISDGIGDGKRWLRCCAQNKWLFLSNLEALYLFGDLNVLTVDGYDSHEDFYKHIYKLSGYNLVRKFIVYRYLQKLGWIVRDGISFGVDFLLYKGGVQLYHSSIGIRIVEPSERINDNYSLALKRELSNCKKSLMLASVEMPDSAFDLSDFKSICSLEPQLFMFNTWSWNKVRIGDLDTSNGDKE